MRWGVQAAQAQLRLRGAEVYHRGERPAAHDVPGQEGRLHGDRSGRVPQHDRGVMCLHYGQHLHSLKLSVWDWAGQDTSKWTYSTFLFKMGILRESCRL